MTQLSRTLAELRAKDEDSFGGKSASLGELIAGGIPVPPGFAVSTAAFEAFLALDGLGERIDARLRGLDPQDLAAVEAACAEIALQMRRTPVPEAVAAEVERHYGALAAASEKRQPPVAVRSSARGEDSAEATFAGQQETYLWVRGTDGVCEAIRGCWISLYSPPAIAYRARMGSADAQPPAMGVAVQAMVDAEVSGVMFTCSPLTGDPSVVAINASWGLGLGVVGGEVTPDDFLISKVSRELLRSTIADKHVEYVPDPGGRGTHRVAVEQARRTRALPRRGAPARSGRDGAADRAPLRLAPGRRVGDRAHRQLPRQPLRAPVATGHGDGEGRIGGGRRPGRPGRDVTGARHLRSSATEGLSLALSDEDVSEILRIIDSSQLDELEIETPSFSLRVTRGGARARPSASPKPPPSPRDAAPAPPAPPPPSAASSEIEAPMLGTFYRTESPAHPPFVELGDHVEPDTVVCLIEVMKLMNHIQAGVSGTIVEILAASGELVEFGQPIFRVALERE